MLKLEKASNSIIKRDHQCSIVNRPERSKKNGQLYQCPMQVEFPNPQDNKKTCAPLSVIVIYSESRLMLSLVNVISRLLWSHFEIPFTIANYIKTTGYCYHSVNIITFGLAQCDHIKRLLLYSTRLESCVPSVRNHRGVVTFNVPKLICRHFYPFRLLPQR